MAPTKLETFKILPIYFTTQKNFDVPKYFMNKN